MKTIRKFIESVMNGATVSANKVYYTPYLYYGKNSRSFCIRNTFGLGLDSWMEKLKVLKSKLEEGFDEVTLDCTHYPQSSTIRLKFEASQKWADVEQKFFGICAPYWKEVKELQVPKEEVKVVEEPKVEKDPKDEIEKMIDNLQVGMNVTILGVGFASDEEDLERMKNHLRELFGIKKDVVLS